LERVASLQNTDLSEEPKESDQDTDDGNSFIDESHQNGVPELHHYILIEDASTAVSSGDIIPSWKWRVEWPYRILGTAVKGKDSRD
ncbi:hypothetical protein STEG23_005701, partial [Scotinomys teguina]